MPAYAQYTGAQDKRCPLGDKSAQQERRCAALEGGRESCCEGKSLANSTGGSAGGVR